MEARSLDCRDGLVLSLLRGRVHVSLRCFGRPTRGTRVAVLAVVVFLVVVPSVAIGQGLLGGDARVFGGSSFGRDAPGASPQAMARLLEAGREAQRAEDEREEFVASEEGRAERARSRSAFGALSDAGAVDLMRREFASELRPLAPDAETLLAGDRVVEYFSDFVARVEGSEGRPDRIIDSQLALRTPDSREVVDLDLEPAGSGYAPDAGLADVALGAEAKDGLKVGRLRLTPEGDARAVRADSDTLVYPNATRDTDVAVNVTPTGLETLHQLRSPDSPEMQRMDVELPAGSQLRATNAGGAEVLDAAGELKVTVSAPSAVDAQGTDVPVSMAVTDGGAGLELTARHRDRSFAYPILVDPEFVVKEDWACAGSWNCTATWFHGSGQALAGLAHWQSWAGGSDSYGLHKQCSNYPWFDNCYGPAYGGGSNWNLGGGADGRWSVGNTGLHVVIYPNTWYPADSLGEWYYVTPGQTTQIYRADFGAKFLRNRGGNGNPFMFTGIYSYADWNWVSGTSQNPGTEAFVSDMTHGWNANWGYTRPGPQAAAFGFMSYGGAPNGVWRDGYMGAAIIELTDPEAPTFSNVNMTGPTGWTKDGTFTFAPTASDPGLGMRRFRLSAPGIADQDRWVSCYGTKSLPCPQTYALDANKPATDPYGAFRVNASSLPDGQQTITIKASDALAGPGHDTTATATVKIDRTGPTIATPTGPLYENRNQTGAGADHRKEGLYEAQASISASASDPHSGTKTLQLFVDRNRDGDYDDLDENPKTVSNMCTATQCPGASPQFDYTLATDTLPDGDYNLKLVAYDLLDNKSADKTWTVTIDRRGDVFNGRLYLDGVAGTGSPRTEEWSSLDRDSARSENRDHVTTIAPSTCGAASCLEWREVGYSIDEPRTAETFSRQTFALTDPNIERVGEMADGPSGNKTGEGGIVAIAEEWQTLPPAHSSEYEVYEGSSASEKWGELLTRKEYVDKATKLPIHTRVTDADGYVVEDYRWTYDRSRKGVSEYPPAHFKVERPSTVTGDQEIQARATATPGLITDTETNSTFRSVYAGDAPALGALRMCLAGSALVRDHDSNLGDTFLSADPRGASDPPLQEAPEVAPFPPDPPDEPPIPGNTVDLEADPYGPMTWVDTAYRELNPGEACLPGSTKLPDDSPLSIRTLRRTGSLAFSARREHTQVGEAVALDPTHDDFAFSGTLPVVALGAPNTAYLVRTGENESSALLDTGDVTVILSGNFTKAQLPTLASALEEAR